MHGSVARLVRYPRRLAGVLLLELGTWLRVLRSTSGGWRLARNRNDSLELAADGSGVRVPGQWTSPLLAPSVIPALGRALYRRAIDEHPIVLDRRCIRGFADTPEASVLIGHRGADRIPHLLAVLSTIASQRDVSLECIVVEQSPRPELARRLPPWVRYAHQDWPEDLGYGRAHAFNLAAELARAPLLVMHDNDMLIPDDYVTSLSRRAREGFEVVNLKRFIFYLERSETRRFFESGRLSRAPKIETVLQNLLGGGSVAITKHAFREIGRFDESFVGWGGEDVDFWERAQTRRVFSWGCLPLVHLWHPRQAEWTPGKETPGMARLEERSKIPAAIRINELLQAPAGEKQRRRPS